MLNAIVAMQLITKAKDRMFDIRDDEILSQIMCGLSHLAKLKDLPSMQGQQYLMSQALLMGHQILSTMFTKLLAMDTMRETGQEVQESFYMLHPAAAMTQGAYMVSPEMRAHHRIGHPFHFFQLLNAVGKSGIKGWFRSATILW